MYYVIFIFKFDLVVYTMNPVNIHKIMLDIRIKQHMIYCMRVNNYAINKKIIDNV